MDFVIKPTRPLCSGNQVTGIRREGSIIMFTAPAPIWRKRILSSFQTLVAKYHSVGETDGWHPKTEGKGDKQRHLYFESSINNILAPILDISPLAISHYTYCTCKHQKYPKSYTNNLRVKWVRTGARVKRREPRIKQPLL